MNRRQKIIVSVTGIFIVLLILIGLTYGYFLTRITGNSNPTSISVTTANLELVYGDGTTALLTSSTPIEPGKFSSSKDFTVTNNGNALTDYAVTLEDFSVTYANDTVIDGQTIKAGTVTKMEYPDDMKMEITCVIESDNEDRNGQACGNVDGTLPTENSILLTNSIEVDDIHKYVLTLTYVETGSDQSKDMNKTIRGKIDIIDPKSTIDLTGTVASYQTGDYVEINSTPIKSEIVDGRYKIIGVEPGEHTLYVKYVNSDGNIQTRGSQTLIIKKGDEASVSGTTITFTDASRVATVDVTSTYTLDISETIDLYNPTPKGALAYTFNNGNTLKFTTNTIVDDSEIKTKAVSLPFSVTNTGNDHMKLTIKLTDVKMDEALKNIDFRWGLYNTDTGNALSFGIFKYTGNEEIIYRDTILDAANPNLTNNYILRIWVHNNGTAQTELLNKSFKGTVQIIGEKIEYTPDECFIMDSGNSINVYDPVYRENGEISYAQDDLRQGAGKCPKNVVIPKYIDNKEVKGISCYNFFDDNDSIVLGCPFANRNLETFIIPEGISLAGEYGEYIGLIQGNNIKHITIPENVKLENMALANSSLTSIYIAESAQVYGDYALYNNNLTTLILNTYGMYDTFNGNPIRDLILMESNDDQLLPLSFAGSKFSYLEVPKNIKFIYNDVFYGNNNIEKIVIRGKSSLDEFIDVDGFYDGIIGFEDKLEFRP